MGWEIIIDTDLNSLRELSELIVNGLQIAIQLSPIEVDLILEVQLLSTVVYKRTLRIQGEETKLKLLSASHSLEQVRQVVPLNDPEVRFKDVNLLSRVSDPFVNMGVISLYKVLNAG